MADAETRAAIEQIRDRIDAGWGKWIACDEGWWPILARLDHDLAEIDPGYVIFQVKEKMAGLRFYFEPSREEYCGAMDARVAQAEAEAARTCEVCGQPGAVAYLAPGHVAIKTLCDAHLSEPDGPTWVRRPARRSNGDA